MTSTLTFVVTVLVSQIRSWCPRVAEELRKDVSVVDNDSATTDRRIRNDSTVVDDDFNTVFEQHMDHPKRDAKRRLNFARGFAGQQEEDADAEESVAGTRALGSVHGMRKEALHIGINYIGSSAALAGCIADANNMRDYFVERCGVDAYLLMTDKTYIQPTKAYMEKAISYMVGRLVRNGGTLIITNSSHGSQLRNQFRSDNEADGMDECLVPKDYTSAGMIRDDDVYQMLVPAIAGAGPNARCLFIADCCHAGTIGDLANDYTARDGQIHHDNIRPSYTELRANIVLLSACESNQTAADVRMGGKAYGALSNAFLETMKAHNDDLTWRELLLGIHARLSAYTQKPTLSSERQLNLDAKVDL